MPIFSRRTLQSLINQNARFLSRKQTRKHVDDLNNRKKNHSVATEWEVVLINALSKLGSVVHEKAFGGSKRGDLFFETKNSTLERFLADITTISGEPDPHDAISEELRKILQERGLPLNSFNLRIGGVHELDRRVGSRNRLKIPGRGRFKQLIFNEHFETFLSRVANNADTSESYEINTREVELTIEYNPNQLNSSGSSYLNPFYVQKYPLTHNRLYAALERKTQQLKRTNFEGPLGIIVCDSGNSLLSKVSSAGLSRTTDEIVYTFLKEENAINFVVLVGVHYVWADCIYIPYWAKDEERYRVEFYLYKGNNFDQSEFVEEIVDSLPQVLPKPIQSPVNAINWLKGRRSSEGMSFQGGYKMAMGSGGVDTIKLSSRALLDLLSGKMSQQEFFELHDFTRPGLPEHTTRNPFQLALSNYQVFSKMSLQKSESKDDDWITFEFGERDPAIGPFADPSSKA